jgi:hypothetical protein
MAISRALRIILYKLLPFWVPEALAHKKRRAFEFWQNEEGAPVGQCQVLADKSEPLKIYVQSEQGDQIGRIFAYWVTFCFG